MNILPFCVWKGLFPGKPSSQRRGKPCPLWSMVRDEETGHANVPSSASFRLSTRASSTNKASVLTRMGKTFYLGITSRSSSQFLCAKRVNNDCTILTLLNAQVTDFTSMGNYEGCCYISSTSYIQRIVKASNLLTLTFIFASTLPLVECMNTFSRNLFRPQLAPDIQQP